MIKEKTKEVSKKAGVVALQIIAVPVVTVAGYHILKAIGII